MTNAKKVSDEVAETLALERYSEFEKARLVKEAEDAEESDIAEIEHIGKDQTKRCPDA